jgi:hypothetical protein
MSPNRDSSSVCTDFTGRREVIPATFPDWPNRAERPERHLLRRIVDPDGFRPRTPRPALVADAPAHWGQFDLAGALRHQQQPATNHVAQGASAPLPVQRLA